MATFLLSFDVILLTIGGLSLGVLFGRSPIRGSCGGLSCSNSIDCGACRARRAEPRR